MNHRHLLFFVFIGSAGAVLGLASTASTIASAQTAPAPTASPDARAQAIADVVAANRILADQNVVDGYGHVSVRDPTDPSKFLLARSMAPELVTAADVLVHDLDGNTPASNAKLYAERFIHAEIYRTRPDVHAIVHCHSPSLIPFGVTGIALRPLYHMSAFLGAGVPVFDIRKAAGGATDMLVRTPVLGRALAQTLGAHPVALMRGHGAVIVGRDIQQVVFRSVYTELNAHLQGQALALGAKVIYLDLEEAKKAEEGIDATLGRPWELWLRKVKDR
ncbi:MAG TPA: class II aldolase/adducin family protein [Kofleriaceae bacterium]|jgi:HCOMODA/2-hydroxy-3-carboxy-muconic semialdehyde decarboxylase|nr:class II aldolase/adducin family protein [Kofleriaceae bacterium]